MPKSLDYYINLPYTTVLEKWDDGDGPYYIARVLELPYCSIHGNTPEEALKEIQRVKKDWFESCLERGTPIPEPAPLNYSGQYHLRMTPYVHRILDLQAKLQKTSLNQLINSLLSGAVVGYQFAHGSYEAIKPESKVKCKTALD